MLKTVFLFTFLSICIGQSTAFATECYNCGFVDSHGVFTSLPDPTIYLPTAISDAGILAVHLNEGPFSFYFYSNGAYRALNLPNIYGYASSINDAGTLIYGSHLFNSSGQLTGIVNVNIPGYTYFTGSYINNSGEVVGNVDNLANSTAAFIYSKGTTTIVNALPGSGIKRILPV